VDADPESPNVSARASLPVNSIFTIIVWQDHGRRAFQQGRDCIYTASMRMLGLIQQDCLQELQVLAKAARCSIWYIAQLAVVRHRNYCA
jgi:hypothetical protein